ncbi:MULTISPECIES: hypothetical protein [Burkholderia]|uniref:hypothetical protein n=1 Tax=Burkholderia TaxID=32008 RepID=UPI000B7A31CC|nr:MULTISPECIES: hypothetical protein [Burkholderia]MPV66361.1 hypothetical protein [Burkholderia sp. BE17]OXJ36021.1 hypothetical protein CFB82_12340 [Burkholderia sp. HI2714]
MGIKEDLAEREASFVSLRKILEGLCAAQAVSLKDAATWLSEELYNAHAIELPEWYELAPGRGLLQISGNRVADAQRALQYVITHGTFAPDWELDPDDIPF